MTQQLISDGIAPSISSAHVTPRSHAVKHDQKGCEGRAICGHGSLEPGLIPLDVQKSARECNVDSGPRCRYLPRMPEIGGTSRAAAKRFSVDARAMLTWGRESIKDHTTAVLELVKNSYDAGATVVEVEISASADPSASFIRITDDGHGMTEADVDQKWLRIGYSDKRQHTRTSKGRRKTGEKGIGRISADRLGAVLELRTQASGPRPSG
jgi:hypothetical protein